MKPFILTILLLSTGLISLGQQALSLENCLQRGMEANYDVRIERNRQQIASNNVTYAPFLPSLTVNARQNQDIFSERTVYVDDTPDVKTDYQSNLYNVDVALGWRLFDGMAMFATHETAKELLKEGDLNLKNSVERLTVDIASQYYFIVTQQQRLEASKLYLEISTLRYNQALEKHLIGSISGVEMNQAKIDFNADSSKFVLQKEIISNSYIQLFELMNGDLASNARLSDSIVPNGNLGVEILRQSAMNNNTFIQLARNGCRLSELNLRIARSSLYPTLDFNAAYRYNYSSRGANTTRFTDYYGPNFGFALSMKLFDRLETRRKIRNAKIGEDNSELLYNQVSTEVSSLLLQLYNTYRKNFMMIDFEQKSADAALMNLEAAMEMYRLGTMSGIEFREIQRSYLEATERKLDAVFNAKISEIELLHLAGMIL